VVSAIATRLRSFGAPHALLLVALLAAAGLAHGWNMFHFPYYEDDEGTYTAQAWSLVTHGTLAPYTYWYDHAPAGWMLLGLWAKLTGGFFTFGFSINSGRVLMLVLHLASTVMLYAIVRASLLGAVPFPAPRRAAAMLGGLVAALQFSLSPLAIYFQRRVLLDNIEVFWLLAAVTLLVFARGRLGRVAASACCFSIASLTKETAVYFLPVLAWLVWSGMPRAVRRYAVALFAGITVAFAGVYVLYAALKNELFPSGTFLGGSHPHVSLIGALEYQVGRGGGLPWHTDSAFRSNLAIWIHADPVLILGGLAATAICCLLAVRERWARLPAGLVLGYLVFLVHGGVVIEYYLIPLVPGLAACLGYTVGRIVLALPALRLQVLRPAIVLVALLAFGAVTAEATAYSGSQHGYDIYTADQTSGQVQAVQWLRTQAGIPYASIDMYGYVDLYGKPHPGFGRVDYYWKIDKDPAVRNKILHDDPRRVDYTLVTPQINSDMDGGAVPFTATVLRESEYVRTFRGQGWWVELWANDNPARILDAGWRSFTRHFVPDMLTAAQQGTGDPELRSLALLASAFAADRETFQHLWKADRRSFAGVAAGNSSQTDAAATVLRTAFALVLADRRWPADGYRAAAKALARQLARRSLAEVGGRPYLVAVRPSAHDAAVVDMAAVDPAAYRALAEVDRLDPWNRVRKDMLQALERCARLPTQGGRPGLPVDYCALAGPAGTAALPPGYDDNYGPRVAQVPFALAVDWRWSSDPSDLRVLASFRGLRAVLRAERPLMTVYDHAGHPLEHFESVSAYAPALGLLIRGRAAFDRVYRTKILGKFYEDLDRSYWEDPQNPMTQLWAWLATALYAHLLRP
jgi:4-amino-4-deoxy-L-arabinose transferase-like glycosyltransferase